jgi:hypothetical protein
MHKSLPKNKLFKILEEFNNINYEYDKEIAYINALHIYYDLT